MIARNPYTIKTSYVSAVNGKIDSGTLASTTYNIGYYDDTKVWEAIDEIEEQVDGIESSMATKQWVEDKHYLDSVPSEYITETELSQELDSYATVNYVDATVDEIPLTEEQMNELFPIEQ